MAMQKTDRVRKWKLGLCDPKDLIDNKVKRESEHQFD